MVRLFPTPDQIQHTPKSQPTASIRWRLPEPAKASTPVREETCTPPGHNPLSSSAAPRSTEESTEMSGVTADEDKKPAGNGGDTSPISDAPAPRASRDLVLIPRCGACVRACVQEVFESHRVVFTVGTSIASVLTAWAGYSLRHMQQTNIDKRLHSIEQSVSDLGGDIVSASRDAHPCHSLQWSIFFHCSPLSGDVSWYFAHKVFDNMTNTELAPPSWRAAADSSRIMLRIAGGRHLTLVQQMEVASWMPSSYSTKCTQERNCDRPQQCSRSQHKDKQQQQQHLLPFSTRTSSGSDCSRCNHGEEDDDAQQQ